MDKSLFDLLAGIAVTLDTCIMCYWYIYYIDDSSFLRTSNLLLQELMNWHRPRVEALLKAGVDILALETIPAQVYRNATLCFVHAPNHSRHTNTACHKLYNCYI